MAVVSPRRQVVALLPDDRVRTVARLCQGAGFGRCAWTSKTLERKLVRRVLPHASVVADPFHVIQDANRRVDEARRVEQELCRWPLLKNQEELTPKQAETLRAIYRRPVPLGQRAAAGLLPCPHPAQAHTLLDRLLFFLQHAEDAELVRWGRTLRSWKAELWSYHQHRVTSAYTEGIPH
jgi:transposase